MKRFINIFKKFGNALTDTVFQVRCPYCGKIISRKEYACESCKKKFPENALATYANGGYKCAVPFSYSGCYRKAVLNFKFYGCGAYAKQLAFMIVTAVNEVYAGKNFDLITCVPMHKTTLKKRGYNQARLLARECAEIMGIEYADILEKIRESKAQHSIKASERAKNVKGVYRICNKDTAYGKRVLIIDDIITTGSTLGECAQLMMKSGCKEVCCAALCATTKS